MKKRVWISAMVFVLLVVGGILGGTSKASAAVKCYTIGTGNTTVYSNTGLSVRYGAIYASDQITVRLVKDAYCKVTYPTSRGSKTGYIRTNAILTRTLGSSYTAKAQITTYKRPGGASYGYISKGDRVKVLGTYGNYTQVKYPVTGGYKYAFVTTSSANSYITGNGGSSNSVNSYYLSGRTLVVKGVSMYEYLVGNKYTSSRYANVNGRSVDMYGWQCCGYARYIQQKLYGCHDKNSPGKFRDVSGVVSSRNLTAAKMKSIVNAAGVGAHIRTNTNNGYGNHSMVIIGISSTGFTIADANSDGRYTVRVKTFTWSGYVSAYGRRGILYTKKYVG